MDYEITRDHRRWTRNARQRFGGSAVYYFDLIRVQEGRCAFSGVPLRFDAVAGTAVKGSNGCHPLYASLLCPTSDDDDFAIVCFALNDIKKNLPQDCFVALTQTAAWNEFIAAWHRQATLDASDAAAFHEIRHQGNG